MAPHMGIEVVSEDDTHPNGLKEVDRPMNTGGRAPCPAVQSDGGTAGDAGNTSATAKSLGNDPSTSISGCIDSTDTDDWYGIQLSANKDVVVVLGNFGDGTNVDFDLGLSDSTGTNYVDVSASYATEERVTFTTNSTTAGTYYIQVVHWAGDGSYDVDVWTNNSVPKPDLAVNSISGPATAMAGDTVDITYTIENYGPGDTNSTNPYDVVFILSTDDTYDWGDTIVESQIAGPYVAAGSNSVETSQVTIPVDIDSDDYHWIVWPDGWGNVTEADDLNNNNASSAVTTISGMPCPNDDDASTGSDIGELETDAHDLGAGFSGIITGCVAGGDKGDLYKLSMGRNQTIEATLTADNWDADIDLRIWNATSGTTLDSGVTSSSNESISTVGTASDGAADTYFINVTQFSGLANYTLEIWTNGTIYIPPYDCGAPSDWGQSNADAGSTRVTAMSVGENPIESGMGCVDPEDMADAYGFTLSGMHGMIVDLESHDNTNMHLQLFDSSDDSLITEMYSTNGTAMVDTSGLDSSDLNGGYYVIVNAFETEGWYNLSFTATEPPLPNLVASAINCPVNGETTGTNVFFGAEISSVGGPMDSAFGWEMVLVDENGTEVLTLLQGAYTDALDGNDGPIITDGSLVLLDSAEISSGNYSCVLTVDGGGMIAESNEVDNINTSSLFEIINYDEMFADDLDRDGVSNDDDACPNTPGDSTMDRLGCQDADGDGYSNGGDVFIYESTQWNDTDGDGFGDNNGPNDYNGDDCPNEPGIMSGTNGTGCPIWTSDVDGDGISDQNDACPYTEEGAMVDVYGCALDADGDGVADTFDMCPNSPEGTQVGILGCIDTDGDGFDDFVDYCLNSPEGAQVDETGCSDEGEPVEPTGDPENPGTTTDEVNNDPEDDTESSGDSDGEGLLMVIIIAAGAVLLLVVVLGLTVVLRSRGAGSSDPTEQAWATAISPEQQAYEQQLTEMGYTAEQARAYASQYFQN
ncbi:MAG: CARDB domain-containing protein [Candidatus Thermoplasmatota archaeon]|nr:CARDB domain-containing protein [Candidatus Thermoplasmatota archaeon]